MVSGSHLPHKTVDVLFWLVIRGGAGRKRGAWEGPCCQGANLLPILSHTTYQFNGLRHWTPPQTVNLLFWSVIVNNDLTVLYGSWLFKPISPKRRVRRTLLPKCTPLPKLSHTSFYVNGFRHWTLPQDCPLIVLMSNSKQWFDDFVGGVTFWSHLAEEAREKDLAAKVPTCSILSHTTY